MDGTEQFHVYLLTVNKLAIFYHCRLSGGSNVDTGASIPRQWGRLIFERQMSQLKSSNLYRSAKKIYVGINGGCADVSYAIRSFAPGDLELTVWAHGEKSASLLPTMRYLQGWLPGHEDYYVLFFHSKGATHPFDPFTTAWRQCMEKHCLWNWQKCVADLDSGADVAGCHWVQGRRDDPQLRQPRFYGGVFWWAKASFLLKLPPLPETITKREDWFEPEWWIGSGPTPIVKDYHPQWPNLLGCSHSAMGK